MSKTKKCIFISLFALALMVMGVGAVKAANSNPLAVKHYEIMCLDGDKTTILTEKNATTLCYIVASEFTAAGESAGFISMAYSGDGLKIIGTQEHAAGSKSIWVAAGSSAGNNTKVTTTSSDAPAAIKEGKTYCPAAAFAGNNTAIKGVETAGCGLFYTPSTSSDYVFSKANMGDSSKKIIDQEMAAIHDYGVVGAFKVQISAEEGSGCGQICVQTYEVKDNVDWTCIASATSSSTPPTETYDGQQCPSGTPVVSTPPCAEVHYNITPKVKPEPENTKTGAFASYTILAAGALIAISAITIAKKHNRISKI